MNKIIRKMLLPFEIAEAKSNKIKGSALQLAMISSLILATGGYYMSSMTNSVVKASQSFVSTNMKKELGLKLQSASNSIKAIQESSKKNSKLKVCLDDFETCTGSGSFALYSSSGKRLSGKYDRYGKNCSESSCSKEIVEVKKANFKIVEKSGLKKMIISYESVNLNTGKTLTENYLSDLDGHELPGVGNEKSCGSSKYMVGLKNGIAECESRSAYVGPDGPRGIDGKNGKMGPMGFAGPKGPKGPRGPRGSLYWVRTGGCFAPDTLITLHSGERKLIKDLETTDVLLNPVTGEKLAIENIVKGPEYLPMVQLNTNNFKTEVTLEHPMVVKNILTGFQTIKMAKDVAKGELIQTKNGFEFVTNSKQVLKGDDFQVYNIKLVNGSSVSDHLVEADGFVTGDLLIQKMLTSEAQVSVDSEAKLNLAH
jgi:hypothetical protein